MNLFEFKHYTDYLRALFDAPDAEKGMRSRLADALGCQTSFVSQVLSGRLHFSLEHALQIALFLNLNRDETEYFILLVQKAKAGTQNLQKYFENQLANHLAITLKKRELVKERIGIQGELSEKDQTLYYSAWWYMAIHIFVALPGLNTKKALIQRLNLPVKNIESALKFLTRCGLIFEKKGIYQIGKTRIHLGTDSPLLSRHHVNWRIKAIEAAERVQSQDLQYSALLGISKVDAQKIKTLMLDLIQKSEPMIARSKEEAPYVMLMDFFEL